MTGSYTIAHLSSKGRSRYKVTFIKQHSKNKHFKHKTVIPVLLKKVTSAAIAMCIHRFLRNIKSFSLTLEI